MFNVSSWLSRFVNKNMSAFVYKSVPNHIFVPELKVAPDTN